MNPKKKTGEVVSMHDAIEITHAFTPQKADRETRFPHAMPDGMYHAGMVITSPTEDEKSLVGAGWARKVRGGSK